MGFQRFHSTIINFITSHYSSNGVALSVLAGYEAYWKRENQFPAVFPAIFAGLPSCRKIAADLLE
jgi:hypothetical protein